MRMRSEIEEMRAQAYAAQGWEDGVDQDAISEKDRAFAEGVEAALLWVLRDADSPFARR